MNAFADAFHFIYLQLTSTAQSAEILHLLITLSPLALALVLLIIFCELWVNYVRAKYFLKEGTVVVEVRLPKETIKSPRAMELFLTALHQTGGEGNWFQRYW